MPLRHGSPFLPRSKKMIKKWVIPSAISLMMGVFCPSFAQDSQSPRPKSAASVEYLPKDYAYLYGMSGFSDSLLKMHFQLYLGYVKNTNLLLARLKELEMQDKDLTYDYGALKRRLGWEWDGMRLHELYFENLGGDELLDKSDPLFQRIVKDFGSYEAWKKSFIATGLMRGIGWVILYRDPQTGRLYNTWINEHDVGHLAGGDPLLVMDVFEHAYITQYGLDRGKYITAFFDNIDWENVSKRYSSHEAAPNK
jgi:superoxide dismutase, Fe-Mn family